MVKWTSVMIVQIVVSGVPESTSIIYTDTVQNLESQSLDGHHSNKLSLVVQWHVNTENHSENSQVTNPGPKYWQSRVLPLRYRTTASCFIRIAVHQNGFKLLQLILRLNQVIILFIKLDHTDFNNHINDLIKIKLASRRTT